MNAQFSHRTRSWSSLSVFKAIIFLVALLPALQLFYAAFFDPLLLGANPAEFILHKTGDWSLYLLLATLMITPLRRLTRWNNALKFRRMLGLYAFFYVCLHFLTYIAFDRLFDFSDLAREISKRPFILVGFLGFLLMIPLAVTSTRAWVLRLGGAVWTRLHRLVYFIATLGVVHYWWLVKRDLFWPISFALVLAVLLAYRLFMQFRPSRARHHA